MNIILLIKTLQKNLAGLLFLLLKTAKEPDKKIISLVKTIDITIDTFIFKAKLYIRSILKFDEDYKNA